MKYKYKNSTGTKKKAIGGLVNKGVSSIAGAISNDSDFNKGAQILGSVAGTTADILTGNIPGAISNGADLVRDGVNAFGEDVDMNTLKTVTKLLICLLWLAHLQMVETLLKVVISLQNN
jgi:hypothetical protein